MRKYLVLTLIAILAVAISGCLFQPAPTPAPTKAILKGQVVVPQGAVRQVGGQALPGATVNIIDPKTGEIIATTTTDANGNYQAEVPPGGPYIIEAVKGNLKVLDVSPQVEVGQTYDLGTADATSTAVALVFQAKVEAGEDPAQINLDEILEDPKIGNLIQAVEEALAAGEDPTTAPEVTQVVEVIITPPKPSTPTTPSTPVTPTPTPSPTISPTPPTPTPTIAPTPTYTLTLTGEGLSSVPPAGEIPANTSVTITVTPPSGKQVATFTVNDEDKKSELVENKYTFTITANTTVVVTYEEIPVTYTITATAGEGGTIEPSGEVKVNAGEDKTFTITPNDDYAIEDVVVDGESVGAVDTYTFENVDADHTISASFVREHSTYGFSYDVPTDILVGVDLDVDVTFKSEIVGLQGYDGVRFKFAATGPGDVTFKATDSSGNIYTVKNSGYWGPEGGFDIPAEYEATTKWTLNFSQSGSYTITFSLIYADTEEIVAGITESKTITVPPFEADGVTAVTSGGGLVQWTDVNPGAGNYSAKLYWPVGGSASLVIPVEGNAKVEDISGWSYWAKAPENYIPNITFYIDDETKENYPSEDYDTKVSIWPENDGQGDTWIKFLNSDTHPYTVWQYGATSPVMKSMTWEEFVAPWSQWGNNFDFSEATVVGVRIGKGVIGTGQNITTYVDDITIDGTTYEIEP